jgi:CheY-like chemotaxis protein
MRYKEGKEIHTPIILLTAGVVENEGSVALSGLFDDFVRKPFHAKEIFGKIEKHLGVQFVYQPSALSDVHEDKTVDTAALTPSDLFHLTGGWLEEFFQCLRRGRSAQLLNLIDQIPTEHADLARTLAELVRIHRFDKLIAATGGALQEKSNG